MSADNGVYILITQGDRGGLEYRVAHTQNIENLRWNPETEDYEQGYLNREFAQVVFADSSVYTDEGVALIAAKRVYDEWMRDIGVMEYGIKPLDYSAVRFRQEVTASR